MNVHIRYFEKKLNKLDDALRRCGDRERQVREIRAAMEHYRAAIRALNKVEAEKPNEHELYQG